MIRDTAHGCNAPPTQQWHSPVLKESSNAPDGGENNAVDNCPLTSNSDQEDINGDTIGDAFDPTPNGGA
jgi:hypothetical protein